MKLYVIIEQDEEGYYVAEVPALPGCLSQGKTYEEAIANIKEAIEGWIEVMGTLSIPQHDELDPGLLRKLIHKAGLTVEEFNEL